MPWAALCKANTPGWQNKFAEFFNYTALEQYRDFSGIRVEEDYLITQNGYRLLGKKLPMTVDDVEAVREESLS